MSKKRFAEKLLKAVSGAKGLVEPSYVYLPGVPGGEEIAKKTGVDFFSVPIELGVSGYIPNQEDPKLTVSSPTVPRRPSISLVTLLRRRSNFLPRLSRDSRATSRRVSPSPTPARSDFSLSSLSWHSVPFINLMRHRANYDRHLRKV